MYIYSIYTCVWQLPVDFLLLLQLLHTMLVPIFQLMFRLFTPLGFLAFRLRI